GEMVAVTGHSGNGLSTLLELCAGLAEPLAGRVLWQGEDLWRTSPARRSMLRRRVGHVFQRHALISNLTAFENIALPLRYHTEMTNWEIAERVEEQLRAAGIPHVRDRRPEQLSTDQARWVAIARALVVEPELLFLDEPSAGVDPVTAHTIVRKIHDIRRAGGATIVMASRRVRVVREMQCRIVVLENRSLSPLTHLGGSGAGRGKTANTQHRKNL
ncbi:MAG: ATP-binding cassette domain-containing protein, partial [Chitinivibrionales bacterium]|nr:ATP-binding cassette domain-containing protein [Chitinivibrionales bacterium]MBD3394744.1 ATP-binding cassette domain-containing protein [Chitinivibrionales bacterium]